MRRNMAAREQSKVISRQTGPIPILEAAALDLRSSFRTIRKSWVFSLVVVLSLGLGIGATKQRNRQ